MGSWHPDPSRPAESSAFADDVGHADQALRQGLIKAKDDQLPELLDGERLLLVLHGLPPEGGSGRSAAMGLVTMLNAEQQRGLLAFTGLDAFQAWVSRADHHGARPYPQPGSVCARMALEHGCTALVIDVVGPYRRVLTGSQLNRLAAESDPPR
ncbi:MAG: SseB family protein [Actinomycetales bacterium]|nr:SseB family protein [Actinomycetales bacterium]